MERDLILSAPVYNFSAADDNVIVQMDRDFAKLCAMLEMKGFQTEGKTVLQFESAIDALATKPQKDTQASAKK